MSELSEKGILLVGLPKAGKTSFIAALWHVLDSEEVPGSLKLTSLGGDDTYLCQIRDEWLNYKEVVRTTQRNEVIPTIHLSDENGTRHCTLSVPDLSGETYVRQWIDREWSPKYFEAAKSASGILVFIHPNQPLEAPEITPTLRLLPGAAVEDVPPTNIPPEEPVWDAEKAAGIVQLVDVLQFLQRHLSLPLRVAIIVSAWDLIRQHYQSPQEFLKNRTPLLEQFLRTNPESFIYTVFGVSALGVDIENETDTKNLQAKIDLASERIAIVSTDGTSNDITVPLRWALSWHESGAQ